MTTVTVVGAGAGILTVFNMLPQYLKTIKTRHTKDLAKSTFIISSVSSSLWIIYGILKNDFAIMGSNAAVFFLVFSILIMKVRYG